MSMKFENKNEEERTNIFLKYAKVRVDDNQELSDKLYVSFTVDGKLYEPKNKERQNELRTLSRSSSCGQSPLTDAADKHKTYIFEFFAFTCCYNVATIDEIKKILPPKPLIEHIIETNNETIFNLLIEGPTGLRTKSEPYKLNNFYETILEETDKLGRNIYHFAVMNRRLDFILKTAWRTKIFGRMIHKTDIYGNMPIDLAAAVDDLETFQMLVEKCGGQMTTRTMKLAKGKMNITDKS